MRVCPRCEERLSAHSVKIGEDTVCVECTTIEEVVQELGEVREELEEVLKFGGIMEDEDEKDED